mmetsp:Transcript_10949/g.18311  ORF Transcript_10949/g.18311 Transcript_10949/m.18311 type:complete len:88 (-) Transcript_10949:55-318(-)|eukprot:CAMPEP_0168607528 /NCGR_PEP_ID=MMETSP0449_2-20121227/101_1 /TAXON_ID=1082188 /ORGANISM="Strombidium rassoulzadegani, Strain ras09" /LENGTH=87 /DNA_ID=CAMNT_0008647371 /DNA_START=114 /DNA_END=377 /DNA_ORIENTATION=+
MNETATQLNGVDQISNAQTNRGEQELASVPEPLRSVLLVYVNKRVDEIVDSKMSQFKQTMLTQVKRESKATENFIGDKINQEAKKLE